MRGWVTGSVLSTAVASAVLACHTLVNLETKPEQKDAGVEVEAAAAVAERRCAREERRARPDKVVFCNDFDEEPPAADFGMPPIFASPGMVVNFDSYASSPPRSLEVSMPANPIAKPLVFATYDPLTSAERLSLAFDVSFGSNAAFDAARATQQPIGLAGFWFYDTDQILAIGISGGHVVFVYGTSFEEIDFSELVDDGYVVETRPLAYDFAEVDVRLRRDLRCSPDVTQAIGPRSDGGPDVDPGMTGTPIYAELNVNDLPLACARLPDVIPLGTPAKVLIGGFSSRRDEPLEWRFDNIVIRALP